MDETTTVVLLTMGINMAYQLLHYADRKFTEYTEIDFACFHFSKKDNNMVGFLYRSSDSRGSFLPTRASGLPIDLLAV